MFGSKLRSWMEAVRPRKKQHRKEKQNKNNLNPPNSVSGNWQNTSSNCRSSQNDLSVVDKGNTSRKIANEGLAENGQAPATSRYSVNNLSSPESAYSTGYSTDGTSPGAPPDYYINSRTGVKYFPTESERYKNEQTTHYLPQHRDEMSSLRPKAPPPTCIPHTVTVHEPGRRHPIMTQEVETRVLPPQSRATPIYGNGSGVTSSRLTEVIASPILTSPRQRNRIRTNPWVPGSTLSPGQIRQDVSKVTTSLSMTDSPVSRRFLSPSAIRAPNLRNQSLSSSSCSSLSGTSIHWESKKQCSGSDEDDCTLNEMMGKYDESYVYEKENDILSDSDPTDCDTDIDTGQDGGDEDDPQEGEFDFIDNGSYLELDPREDRNTGHCIYYNFDVQRKTSRRRTTRRNKQVSERKRKSSSNKKRHKQITLPNAQLNGSKSAGATPLSVRRTTQHPVSKLALEDCLKKRSNSISFSRDPLSAIDKRDKEADKKYRELIVEAEHILRSMKVNGLSPRRVPGPANKRVEILRNTECAKPELFMKNRLNDEPGGPQFNKIPSNNFNCPRFSPKKNHITNFMINNSPVLIRREMELPTSPLVKRPESPLNRNHNTIRRSPKYRKKATKPKLHDSSSTSDSDVEGLEKKDSSHASNKSSVNFGCPQSEPVRRKVYSGRGKTVAFNLNYENICNNNSPPYSPSRFDNQDYKNSSENLRQQVLLNTIANLKKSLEDQSASLKQVYRSSHNIHL